VTRKIPKFPPLAVGTDRSTWYAEGVGMGQDRCLTKHKQKLEIKQMALIIEEADRLPAVTRNSGRVSEERLAIQNALRTGKPSRIPGITGKDEFNALQQRIRTAGQSISLKVNIHSTQTGESEVDGETVPVFDLYFIDREFKDSFAEDAEKPAETAAEKPATKASAKTAK